MGLHRCPQSAAVLSSPPMEQPQTPTPDQPESPADWEEFFQGTLEEWLASLPPGGTFTVTLPPRKAPQPESPHSTSTPPPK